MILNCLLLIFYICRESFLVLKLAVVFRIANLAWFGDVVFFCTIFNQNLVCAITNIFNLLQIFVRKLKKQFMKNAVLK